MTALPFFPHELDLHPDRERINATIADALGLEFSSTKHPIQSLDEAKEELEGLRAEVEELKEEKDDLEDTLGDALKLLRRFLRGTSSKSSREEAKDLLSKWKYLAGDDEDTTVTEKKPTYQAVPLSAEPLAHDHAGVLNILGDQNLELVSVSQRSQEYIAYLRETDRTWDYSVQPLNGSPEEQAAQLDEFEDDGWVPAAVITETNGGTLRGSVVYLKRPIED